MTRRAFYPGFLGDDFGFLAVRFAGLGGSPAVPAPCVPRSSHTSLARSSVRRATVVLVVRALGVSLSSTIPMMSMCLPTECELACVGRGVPDHFLVDGLELDNLGVSRRADLPEPARSERTHQLGVGASRSR